MVLEEDVVGQAVHFCKSRRSGALSLQPGCKAVVSQFCVVMHSRPVDFRGEKVATIIDYHIHNQGKPILVQIQGGEIGRELQGQHRKDPGWRVDGGRVLLGITIYCRALLDKRINICHGYKDPDPPI